MLRKFWISVALRALAMLGSRQFVEDVTEIVKSLIDDDATGFVKRQKAINRIKAVYREQASWLIGAAIELALGYLKVAYPQYFRR